MTMKNLVSILKAVTEWIYPLEDVHEFNTLSVEDVDDYDTIKKIENGFYLTLGFPYGEDVVVKIDNDGYNVFITQHIEHNICTGYLYKFFVSVKGKTIPQVTAELMYAINECAELNVLRCAEGEETSCM